jgi:hypothetical protein
MRQAEARTGAACRTLFLYQNTGWHYGQGTPLDDGAALYELRVPFWLLESKEEKDDLEAEIAPKFRRGYLNDELSPKLHMLVEPSEWVRVNRRD